MTNDTSSNTPPLEEWQQPGWKPRGYPQLDPDSALAAHLRATNSAILESREQIARLYPTLDSWFRRLFDTRIENTPLQSLFQPRKLNPPGGFSAVVQVAAGMYSTCGECGEMANEGMTPAPTQVTALTVLYNVLRYGVQTYYVSEPFLRAVAATDLPKDFTLLDMHFPMTGMVLGMPVKFMREYCGCEISYVYAADIAEGTHRVPAQFANNGLFRRLPDIKSPAKVGWSFYTYKAGVLEQYVSSFLKSDRVEDALTSYGYTDYTMADEAKVGADKDLNEKVNTLIMKLLFVLNMRPALVEPGKLERAAKVKKGQVIHRELWSANVIGAKYRVINNSTPTGTHAAPKVHWRRGHTTLLVVGGYRSPDFVAVTTLPRRADGEIDWLAVPQETREKFWRSHERRWVEPVLVNVGE